MRPKHYIQPIDSQNPSRKTPTHATGHAFDQVPDTSELAQLQNPKIITTPPLFLYTSTQFITAGVRQIFGLNKRRKYLLIQNVGTVTAFIGFGSVAQLNGDDGVELPAGFQISFESGYCPNNEATGICATQTKLIIVEGNI